MNSSKESARRFPLRVRLQYLFDNLMAAGPPAILLGLIILVFISLVVTILLRIAGCYFAPDETLTSFSTILWRSFNQVTSFGDLDLDLNANKYNKAVGIFSVSIGFIVRAVFVAFIIVNFNRKVGELRKAKSEVIERGHTVILGFGMQTTEIIEQLIIANQGRKGQSIVVLSDTDKVTMDDFLGEYVKNRGNTRIITRGGDICNTKFTQKMSITEASSIIVLNDANVAHLPHIRDRGDEKVMEAIIAVVTSAGEDRLPSLVAQLHSTKSSRLAESILPGRIVIIDTNDILAKILVYTSLNPGLSFVYSSLVGFSGHGVYIHRVKTGWLGYSFGKLQFHFINSVLMGFRTADGEIILNPSPDYVPLDTDEGIFLAVSKDAIKLYRKQVIIPQQQKFFMRKSRIVLERQMIVGWNSKIETIIHEYAYSMRDGSAIDIVIHHPDDIIRSEVDRMFQKYSQIRIRLLDGNVHNKEFLSKYQVQDYDNILILAEESSSVKDVDLKTVSRLLEFRHYLRNWEEESGTTLKTKLVTEVINSDKADIFSQAGAKDFLIPHKFVSEIISQVSQEPDLKKVYDTIFSESSSEIFVKSAELFFRTFPTVVSFADCVSAAQNRGEVCLGVKIEADALEAEKGYGLTLAPDKNTIFHLAEGDFLVTLAENRN